MLSYSTIFASTRKLYNHNSCLIHRNCGTEFNFNRSPKEKLGFGAPSRSVVETGGWTKGMNGLDLWSLLISVCGRVGLLWFSVRTKNLLDGGGEKGEGEWRQ